jgi:hypothetical protein
MLWFTRRRLGNVKALTMACLLACACAGATVLATPAHARSGSAFDCRSQPGEHRLPGGAEYSRLISSEDTITDFYICSFAGGSPYKLGREEDDESFYHADLVFAGERAAVVDGEGGGSEGLQVINLAKSQSVYSYSLVQHPASTLNESGVGRIVLKRDGSLAWTEQQPSGAYQVIEHTPAGRKVLDATNTTRPYSLKLTGSTLSWLEHNGEARSATLD